MAWLLDGDQGLRQGEGAARSREGHPGALRRKLQELYFDVSKDVAYALFKDLGDSR